MLTMNSNRMKTYLLASHLHEKVASHHTVVKSLLMTQTLQLLMILGLGLPLASLEEQESSREGKESYSL